MKLIAIETDIDDMDMRLFAHVQNLLIERGAHQAYMTPLIGKKGRPAIKLTALAKASDVPAVQEILFRETTTLGVRMYEVECKGLEVRFVTVSTRYGKVKVKVGFLDNKAVNIQPEFSDCEAAAKKKKAALKQVLEAAKAAALEKLKQKK